MPAAPEPMKVRVPDARLVDLREQLARVRLAPDSRNNDWSYGVKSEYLAEIIGFWRDGFDWRAQEDAMNAFPHFRVELDGLPIHFLHLRGAGPSPLPIVLTHGWPWTFWDFRELIRPLTDPAEFGADPADAFDVVVPSLPGFGFSTPLTREIVAEDVALLWVELMCDVLGYSRFGAHGGDFGALVTAQLGHAHSERLVGIHFAGRALRLDHWNIDRPWASLLARVLPDDQAERAAFLEWERRKVGHLTAHVLDPQTIAYALHDSPAGLAAWLLERRRAWSDCEGDVERVFSKDDLLTSFTLYWMTDSFVTSARFYRDTWRRGWKPVHDRTPVVDVPTGVSLFLRDLPPGVSQDWMSEYFDLRFVNEVPRGGHFAPAEQPERLVEDLRAFFRPLRSVNRS